VRGGVNLDRKNIISNDRSNKPNSSMKSSVSYKLQRTINSTVNAATNIYTLSLHDALPIYFSALIAGQRGAPVATLTTSRLDYVRSEEHTSELQSLRHLVCRLLLEKKKKTVIQICSLK